MSQVNFTVDVAPAYPSHQPLPIQHDRRSAIFMKTPSLHIDQISLSHAVDSDRLRLNQLFSFLHSANDRSQPPHMLDYILREFKGLEKTVVAKVVLTHLARIVDPSMKLGVRQYQRVTHNLRAYPATHEPANVLRQWAEDHSMSTWMASV